MQLGKGRAIFWLMRKNFKETEIFKFGYDENTNRLIINDEGFSLPY